MALTSKQEITVTRAWGVGMGQDWKLSAVSRIPSEHRTLVSDSLRVAAAQYRKDAIANAASPSVAAQFTKQADLCEKIAELVEL
jgi:hypothetical protein